MKNYFNIVLFFLSINSIAQIKISGTIIDTANTPIPFATIGLISLPDSSIIKGTISDESGKYLITQAKFGKYFLKVSVIGYKEKASQSFVIDSILNKDLQLNIELSTDAQTLGDVSVYAIKKVVEFKNGNIIVNVENSPLAKGNSVYDLLLKLPGVSEENNNIAIQGKSGVIIMIDGRPQSLSGNALINMLKSMNADMIKSIEILKNPPVKYDASGTAGMINIVSKKVTISGITGTLFMSYSQGFYDRMLPGGSLNYKSKKIIFYSNLSSNYSKYRRIEDFNKRVISDTGVMYLNTISTTKMSERDLNYKIGLDWLATKNDVIGIKVEGGPGKVITKTDGRNSVSGINDVGFDHLDFANTLPNKWNSTNIDFNYDHKLDTLGSSFAVVLDYTNLTETNISENYNKFYDLNGNPAMPANNYRSNNKSNSDIIAGRIDFAKFINESSSIESGIKTAYSKTFNDYLFERDFRNNNIYLKDTSFSNKFQYTELTYAGYFNYIKSIKKINMQLGFRLEKTYLTSENNEKNFILNREYFNIFPNFYFEYSKSDDHNFQLNLSRRIDRPDFSNLNPFIFFNDQYFLRQGNPFLLPAYANRGELSYNFKRTISTSIAYSYVENVMISYTSQNDSTKVTLQEIKNMKSSNRVQYSIFYNKSLIKNWDISISGSCASVNYKGNINGIDFQQSGITYNGSISNIILIEKNTKLQVNGTYFGPNVYGIFTFKPRWMTSLAITKSLLNKKLDFTFGIDDIFYSFIFRNETSYGNQKWSFMRKDDSRRFRIALNYKFGKIKIEEREINISNEEEKDRLSH